MQGGGGGSMCVGFWAPDIESLLSARRPVLKASLHLPGSDGAPCVRERHVWPGRVQWYIYI